MATTSAPQAGLPDTEPVATLLRRIRAELSADFIAGRPLRVSRAPGRLDVMGGIADYTGSLVCEYPLACATAVAIQAREDRQVQVFSFNRFDAHEPFTFRVPLDALASSPVEQLRREFAEPGRKWAAYVAGCFVALPDRQELLSRSPHGFNIAVYSTVPQGAGLSSSAALEVATMINLWAELGLDSSPDPMRLCEACQWVENHLVGAACGIMDQVTSCLGRAGKLLRMICQPHELQPFLDLPDGVRVVGIDSGVRHQVAGDAYTRTRCAAAMGHRIILESIRAIGRKMNRELIADPMRGYLANLDPDDYKSLFRVSVPEALGGRDFVEQFGVSNDPVVTIDPDTIYQPRHATDHHVLESRRVRRFVEFLELAQRSTGTRRTRELDRAGHLMYGSHQSYELDAMLGSPECDVLVKAVRSRERSGLYGARITGGGSGGTVAVLADASPSADAALAEIVDAYQKQTGLTAQLFTASSDGAWLTQTEKQNA